MYLVGEQGKVATLLVSLLCSLSTAHLSTIFELNKEAKEIWLKRVWNQVRLY